MPKKKVKLDKFTQGFKSRKFNKGLKISALFFLGFLLGTMFKSQAFQNTVVGYDDHKILKSDEITKKIEF